MTKRRKAKINVKKYGCFYLAFIDSISLEEILNLPLNVCKDKFLVITTIDGDSAGDWLNTSALRDFLKLNIHYKHILDVCLIYPESLDTFLKRKYFWGGDEIYLTSREPSDDQLKKIKGGGYGDFSMGVAKSVSETMKSIGADVYFSDCYRGLSIVCKDRQFVENIVQELGEGWDIKAERLS